MLCARSTASKLSSHPCWSEGCATLTLAFAGTPGLPVVNVILTQWLAKTIYEIVATPLTYVVVSFLKRHEGLDTYDRGTNFNPFSIKV